MTKTLKNEKCIITYKEEQKEIFGRNLTDSYNEPAFYNNTKRSINKAWEALTEQFTENTRMYDAMKILENNNLRCHSYCMMD